MENAHHGGLVGLHLIEGSLQAQVLEQILKPQGHGLFAAVDAWDAHETFQQFNRLMGSYGLPHCV